MILVLQSKLLIIGVWMNSKLLLVSLEVALFALIVWVVLRFVRLRSFLCMAHHKTSGSIRNQITNRESQI